MTIFHNFLLQKNGKTHTDIYWQKLELKIHNGKIVNYSWFRGQSNNVFFTNLPAIFSKTDHFINEKLFVSVLWNDLAYTKEGVKLRQFFYKIDSCSKNKSVCLRSVSEKCTNANVLVSSKLAIFWCCLSNTVNPTFLLAKWMGWQSSYSLF
jgi:hypothetical protein